MGTARVHRADTIPDQGANAGAPQEEGRKVNDQDTVTNESVASSLRPPAPRPCDSCPYRSGVPSGIWAHEEYEKLRRYDVPTAHQPAALFQCHQTDADSDTRRICAGWAGCHDGAHLFSLRIAVLDGRIEPSTHQAVVDYISPVPLFASGNEAADHGQADLDQPTDEAERLINKISRTRTDLLKQDQT
ncbi:DUF6283 family protein [Streptomyces sp. NPDC048392]|uniref:DUF6283 family protein n=1 Tax=Streptomyces sp. NPDC048392 TaxID=3365543 RepID=UPI00370FDAF1